MATLRFVLKRLAAQRLLALAMIVTLAFSVGVLVAGPIYADAGRGAILSSTLRSVDVTTKNVRLTLFADQTFPYQKANTQLHQAVGALPVRTVIRQGFSDVVYSANGRSAPGPVLFRDGAAEHLKLTGKPPVGPGQIALPNGTAQFLRVKIGGTVFVRSTGGRVPLEVTGTFIPPNTSGYWFGSLTPWPPVDSTQPAPAILDRTGYLGLARRIQLNSQFVWDVYLRLAPLSFDQFRTVPGTLASISRFPPGSPMQGAQVTTGLPTLLLLVEQRTANLRVPVYVVVFQIGAVALAVLAGVASLALSRQSFELAVLRSRGFSRAKLLVAQGVQTVLTAAIGYPIGLVIGVGLAGLATHANGTPPPGTHYPISLSLTALLAGAVGAVVGAILLLLMSIPAVSRTVVEERRLLSREARPLLARLPVELFVLPLGIAAFYEVKTRGFLPLNQTGSLDPLVVLAPTLLLFATSFLALRLLLFVLRRLEGPIGRTRALPAYLAGRRLARSPGTSFAISLLLVLSVGLLVVSTSYRATVIRSHEDTARQDIGADWQVSVGAPTQPLPLLGRLPPGTTPIVSTDLDLSSSTFPVAPNAIGIDPGTYARGGWWRGDYSNLSLHQILSDLSGVRTGQPLPAGTTGLQLQVTSPSSVSKHEAILAATVERPNGGVAVVDLGRLRPGTTGFQVGTGPAVALLSLIVQSPGNAIPALDLTLSTQLEVSTGAGSRSISLARWQPLLWRGSTGTIADTGTGLAVHINSGEGDVIGGLIPPEEPLPALASPSLGGTQTFQAFVGDESLSFRIIGEAQAFPSAGDNFLVVPIRPLILRILRSGEPSISVNEVWAMGSADPRREITRSGFVVGDTVAAATTVSLLSEEPQSLAVGMNFTAAAGGMGLVIIGVAVGLYFTQRRREFEFASLRAMGSPGRQISAVLLVEQAVLIAFAVAGGGLLGFGILRLMMPYLGKSIGAGFPNPVLVLDWRWLGLYGAAGAAATALGLFLALRAVLRSSVTGVLRGEAE